MCLIAYTPPSPKSDIYWHFPPVSWEQFLRALWGAVSWAAVLILPQIKINLQLILCIFFKLTEELSWVKSHLFETPSMASFLCTGLWLFHSQPSAFPSSAPVATWMQHHGPLYTSWMGSPLPREGQVCGCDMGHWPWACSGKWALRPGLLVCAYRPPGMPPPPPATGLTSGDLSQRPEKPFAFGLGSRWHPSYDSRRSALKDTFGISKPLPSG